eukprot:PhF_6_TR37245/c0_g1_i1/m.54937
MLPVYDLHRCLSISLYQRDFPSALHYAKEIVNVLTPTPTPTPAPPSTTTKSISKIIAPPSPPRWSPRLVNYPPPPEGVVGVEIDSDTATTATTSSEDSEDDVSLLEGQEVVRREWMHVEERNERKAMYRSLSYDVSTRG